MNFLKSLRRHDSTPPPTVKRKHIPWIQSPIDEDKLPSTSQPHALSSGSPVPCFKHYDDTHTIELVFDMFIVAILSTFSSIHGIEDMPSLRNFVGFFTLLWWSWMQTVMFDVRFGVDSIFDRACKAVTLLVTTAYMLGGSVWDIEKIQENKKGFSLLAVALTVSRAMLALQYGVVAIYARKYKATRLPLLLMIATLLTSSLVFLGTFFFIESRASPHSHIIFYVITSLEGLGMLLISCIWRVLSFKDTRFTTRMSDSTMIMLGEGAVGLAVSVSKIMSNSASISHSIGVTVASVLLIYFTWMLYFDQFETSRFGKIRQQIWAIIHYPLNLATVFLLEGMRELLAYNTIVGVERKWLATQVPDKVIQLQDGTEVGTYDLSDFATGQDLVNYMQDSFASINATLQSTKEFEKKFNATPIYDLLTSETVTTAWDTLDDYYDLKEVIDVAMLAFWGSWTTAIYEHFGVTLPTTDHLSQVNMTALEEAAPPELLDIITEPLVRMINEAGAGSYKSGKYYELFMTIFWYFPLGAAVYLFLLALMYWFGRRKMSKYEWCSVGLRVLGGIHMIVYCLLIFYLDGSWVYSDSPWVVPVVTLTFFVIIIGDNLIITWGNKVYDKREGQSFEKDLTQTSVSQHGYQHVPSQVHGDYAEPKFSAQPIVSTHYVSPSSQYAYDNTYVIPNQR